MTLWLALTIGNSRLHWAVFVGNTLQTVHHTPYLSAPAIADLLAPPWQPAHWAELLGVALPQAPRELWVASVVPEQTTLWEHPEVQIIHPSQVPLQGGYATLGLDRKLALWGAGSRYGYPVLVVDAGTALTLTATDEKAHLIGGAILPGLGLQLRSLAEQTAALPALPLPGELPPRWAKTTAEAIQSGVIYTAIAGLQRFFLDWRRQFPQGSIVLTGGDASQLLTYLRTDTSWDPANLWLDPTIGFQGIATLRQRSGRLG